MFALRTWGLSFLAAFALLATHSYALAGRSTSTIRTASITQRESITERVSDGSPILGWLIIIGVVGFVIVVAWIFSRMGEGSNRQSDSSLN
jgi:hypothetical protein